jgi:UDP-N-acetylglucosamine 4,6-dehydratase/5-epimerase
MDWSAQTILVTGGTGTFGRAITRLLLDEFRPARLIVFSRDEDKQREMRQLGFDHPSLRYFIGSVRDVDRLRRAMHGVTTVVHAAALKQVPACEYNPIEAVTTNIMGTCNVIEAALDRRVARVLTISTDKAVNPVNLYGATKLVAEKLLVQANAYSGDLPTRFSCCRYGNVVGSRGSVVPLFQQQGERGVLTLTHPDMTRFWLTKEQGVRFAVQCVERMHGGEVFVPKIPSMRLVDLARALAPDADLQFVGIRPGEKVHEVLVSEDESRNARDMGDHYSIHPAHPWWPERHRDAGDAVPEGFSYTSNGNDRWLSVDELRALLDS